MFWSDSVQYVVHLINRLPYANLQGKSPFEMLYNVKVNYDYMRTFGSLCYASTLQTHRHKFAQTSMKCVFLGYPLGIKGYKCYEVDTKQVIISRDVIF